MKSTTQSHDGSGTGQPEVDFRKIGTDRLRLPAGLFDERTAAAAGVPEMLIPLTVCREGDGFIVLDGCKRLLHAKKTGLAECICGVITPAPDIFSAALLRISLNRGRSFNFFEKILYVKWLRHHCSEAKYRKIGGRLPIDKRELYELERLSECDRSIIDAVEAGTLESGLAVEVDQLTTADRTEILSLFGRYAFSRQMQRELLDWLPELAFREKSTIVDVINSEPVASVENDEKCNNPQKIQRLRQVLFDRRFPNLSRAKKRWSQQAAKLNPAPSRVTFKPSEAFEKNRLEMRITVTDGTEATAIFSRLSEVSSGEWEKLIYPAQFEVKPE
jgi:hypothetical protein